MKHIALLHKDSKYLAVQINPIGTTYEMYQGKPNKEAQLAFNINYSWLGLPIGLVRSNDSDWKALLHIKEKLRPCLCIHNGFAYIAKPKEDNFFEIKPKLIAQAGPTLLFEGKDVTLRSDIQEEFRSDAVRRTLHVALGCTLQGKIVAICAFNASLTDLARILKTHKCHSGMKCDGGNASSFWFEGVNYGKTGTSKAGIQFIEK